MKKIILSIIAIMAVIIVGKYLMAGNARSNPQAAMPFGTDPSLIGGDAVPTSGNEDVKISAVGTEPFWGFAYQRGTLIWTMPQADEVGDMQNTTIGIGYAADEANTDITLRGLGESNFGAKITKEACSDGMSDNTYTHTVKAMLDGTEYNGCASVERL